MQTGVVGAVLAGGRSRRLGFDKARIRVEGVELLERAVVTLRSVFREVVVVGRTGSHGVPGIADRLPDRGPLGGILSALEHRPPQPVFVLACDLPFVTRDLVLWLLRRSAEGPQRVVYPRVGDVEQPLCGLWAPSLKEAIASHLAAGQRGVGSLLRRLGEGPVDVPVADPVFAPDLLVNVNRPVDLDAIGAEQPTTPWMSPA